MVAHIFCSFNMSIFVFQTLSGLHILEAVEYILSLDDNTMKSAAIDIFSHIVEFSPSIVREFILKEGQKNDDVSTVYFKDTGVSLIIKMLFIMMPWSH